MDKREVYQAVSHWLASDGRACSRATTRADSLRTWGGNEEWFVVLRGDVNEAMQYQRCFDDAIDGLITKNRLVSKRPLKLGVALAFSSSLRKDRLSYRSALKKFSNSIVFSDLGINLMLVKDDHSVELLEPDEVNGFLMDLNRYIISSARDLDE
ncbi:MAG: hypothetical protein N2C13_05010 [Chloroflexota bacterium]